VEIEMDDRTVRVALERHWDASDASDFKVEHEINREDAVLEYPQSGERIRGEALALRSGSKIRMEIINECRS
jgi:hypothetical protein